MQRCHFRFLSLWLFGAVILFGHQGKAQVQSDTLNAVYRFISAYQFKEADQFLESCLKVHPGNIELMSLRAQVLFYSGNAEKADETYRQIIQFAPNRADVFSEYALFLASVGRYREAEAFNHKSYALVPSNERAQTTDIKIQYWRGNYLKAKVLVAKHPGRNKSEVSQLNRDIDLARAPVVNARVAYLSDNQPVSGMDYQIQARMSANTWFNPSVLFQLISWNRYQKLFVEGSNQFIFPDAGLSMKLGGGLYSTGILDPYLTEPVWNAEIEKRFFGRFRLTGFMREKPYMFNRFSLNRSVMQRETGVSLAYATIKGLMLKAAYQENEFRDLNKLTTMYAWALIPVVKNKMVSISTGYGYNFSTSNQSRFEPELSLNDILAAFYNGYQIEGRYNPYFTPIEQHIHAILLNLEWKINPKLMAKVNTSYGIRASSQLPYLYLDNPDGIKWIYSGTALHRFTPVEVSGGLDFKLNPYLNLGLQYDFMQNNFYTSHLVSVGLKQILYREKQGR